MGNSRRFKTLVSRLSYLERSLLPASKPNGRYSKKEEDRIRSYVVLVHAEIESFFEDRAIDKVQKSLVAWRNNRKRSNCLKAVLAFISSEIDFSNDNHRHSIEYRINKIVNHFVQKINKNHGIKEKNLYKILLPIGIEVTQLDNTWLSEMNSFGGTRGNIAHTSIRVQSPLDRDSEVQRINQRILPEILKLDTLISKI